MFTKSAIHYDALYHFKDYSAEAKAIEDLIRQYRPEFSSLLDVACGTGKHLAHWRRYYDVEGVDLSADLLSAAAANCPDIPLHQGDMRDFDLGRRFDVITCLFSSIAYLKTSDNLDAAVRNMARHLAPHGLLIVEPWFTPDSYWVGKLVANHFDSPDLKISWMYVSARHDLVSVMDIHFQVGTPDGVEQFCERHEVGLFTTQQYRSAFRKAGLQPHSDEAGYSGRGLYWAMADA